MRRVVYLLNQFIIALHKIPGGQGHNVLKLPRVKREQKTSLETLKEHIHLIQTNEV